MYCASPCTSPCLGRGPLVALPAVGYALLACCWLCSSCLLLGLLFSVLFILSPLFGDERSSASASSLRCSFLCPYYFTSYCRHRLFGCGLSDSSPEKLCGSLEFPGCLACTSDTTAQHCALRGRWLAVGARVPRSCSLQQRVLLTVRAGLRGSLPLRSVGGFQYHSNTSV